MQVNPAIDCSTQGTKNMSDMDNLDYGPLTELIGVWTGDRGVDVAPDPDGTDTTLYFETISVSEVGGVTNARSQHLAALHYQQVVQRKADGEVFHHENGYWMWDAETHTVMHSLIIPRAVCVLAGGQYEGEKDADGRTVLEVAASLDDPHWTIVQSPFMDENARTTAFSHTIIVGNGTLSYTETTMVDIYGKTVEHTDQNELVLS